MSYIRQYCLACGCGLRLPMGMEEPEDLWLSKYVALAFKNASREAIRFAVETSELEDAAVTSDQNIEIEKRKPSPLYTEALNSGWGSIHTYSSYSDDDSAPVRVHRDCFKWLGYPTGAEMAAIPLSLLPRLSDGGAFTPEQWISESLRRKLSQPQQESVQSEESFDLLWCKENTPELVKPLHLRLERDIPLHCKYLRQKITGETTIPTITESNILSRFEIYRPERDFGYAHRETRSGELKLCSVRCCGHVPIAVLSQQTQKASGASIASHLSLLGGRILFASRKICTFFVFTHRPEQIRSLLSDLTTGVARKEDERLFTLLLGTHKRAGEASPLRWLPKELIKMIGLIYKKSLPHHIPRIIVWETSEFLSPKKDEPLQILMQSSVNTLTDPEWEQKLIRK